MLLKQLEEAMLMILRGINKESWNDVINGVNIIYGEGYAVGSGKEASLDKETTEVKVKTKKKKKEVPVIIEAKKSHYGNRSVPIGNEDLGEEISEKEIQENIKKSQMTREAKISVRQKRVNPMKEVTCDCGNKFQSIVNSKELGSQCSKCLRAKSRNINNE